MVRTESAADAVEGVARELFATESAIDAALIQAVRMMRQVMDARRDLGLPVGADQTSMREIVAAVSALGEAQQSIIRTHRDLHRLQEELRLPASGFGPLIKPREGVAVVARRAG